MATRQSKRRSNRRAGTGGVVRSWFVTEDAPGLREASEDDATSFEVIRLSDHLTQVQIVTAASTSGAVLRMMADYEENISELVMALNKAEKVLEQYQFASDNYGESYNNEDVIDALDAVRAALEKGSKL